MNITTAQRQTKYCLEIERLLRLFGHATNAKLLTYVKNLYPETSATTIHRATSRLASRGSIGIAPSNLDGSMQYDINITLHDHFQCVSCGQLVDINIKDKIIPILESSIKDCSISGQLTITGVCGKCTKKLKK